MSGISGIISLNSNGSLNFGDYKSDVKLKSDDFEVSGDVYKVKTHSEITRVEKNGKLLFESVPGLTVQNFMLNEKICKFAAEGADSVQITMDGPQEVHDQRRLTRDIRSGIWRHIVVGRSVQNSEYRNRR